MAKRGHNIAEQLRSAGDRDALVEFERKFAELLKRYSPSGKDPRGMKHEYAVELSRRLAVTVADALRPDFSGIRPHGYGKGGESPTATGKGDLRLDVNYSTQKKGLALGVSIKTMNFRDGTSRRYTKNIRRIDKELRNEASDIHDRQPYAVLTAIVFMPEEICTDVGPRGRTSFTHNYGVLQDRVGRVAQTDKNDLFEAIWIGLYCIERPVFRRRPLRRGERRQGARKRAITDDRV